MKKTLLLLSLSLLFMYQCKKENKDIVDNNNNNNNKNVRVYCEIPMNSNGKSDFTNIFEGSVSWSSGSESVFLAVPGDNPKLIQLTTEGIEGNPSNLYFETYVSENDITTGVEYDLWYLGNSMHREGITPNVTLVKNETEDITSITGSIAEQSGDLKDVGCFHIAKAKVSAGIDGEDIILTLNTTMENQMSLAYLDLSGRLSDNGLTLKGKAITASGYTLSPVEDDNGNFNFDFILNENKEIFISNANTTTGQYVVLLPNNNHNVVLDCGYLGGHTFKKGIDAGKFYYRKVSELQSEPLVLDVNTYPSIAETVTLDFSTAEAKIFVDVLGDGGADIIEYGVVYSKNLDVTPTLENNDGKFICNSNSIASIPEMVFNNKYNVRAYAINEIGITYTDLETIHYLEYVDMGGGYHISTLNLGANTIYADGDKYEWGSTEIGGDGIITNPNYEFVLGNENDVVYKQGLGNMPSYACFEYLLNPEYCDKEEDKNENGETIGFKFTSKSTGNSVYFKRDASFWSNKSAVVSNSYTPYAYALSVGEITPVFRVYAACIRPVKRN